MFVSIDVVTLSVAVVLLLLALWTAATTRSPLIRFALVAIVIVVVALMMWNMAVRGGLHAV